MFWSPIDLWRVGWCIIIVVNVEKPGYCGGVHCAEPLYGWVHGPFHLKEYLLHFKFKVLTENNAGKVHIFINGNTENGYSRNTGVGK